MDSHPWQGELRSDATRLHLRHLTGSLGGGRQVWFASGLEVLHDCRKVELVVRSGEASQAQAFKAMVSLEVSKSHLDPFPLIAGLLELRCGHECPCLV